MTYNEIADLIDSFELPFAYHHFERNEGPALPFVVYSYPGTDDMPADNINYQKVEVLRIELYTQNKDFDAEAQVETKLKEAGLFYSKDEVELDSENMYEQIYETEVLINGR